MSLIIKIILILMLITAVIFDLPYGYYQFVRFVALIGFVVLGYFEYQRGNQTSAFIYGALALLFQPLFKIALGRFIWNITDVVVAVGLILTLFKPKSSN